MTPASDKRFTYLVISRLLRFAMFFSLISTTLLYASVPMTNHLASSAAGNQGLEVAMSAIRKSDSMDTDHTAISLSIQTI
jgi:hypothetical protein